MGPQITSSPSKNYGPARGRAGPLDLCTTRNNAGYDATRNWTEYADNLTTPTTVEFMAQDVDGFKATAQEILRSDMSDGAKLAALAEALGAANATDIAAALNKPVRTIERHYAELRKVRKSAGTQICGTTQNCGTQICVEVRKSAESGTQICVPSRVDDNNINITNQGNIYNNNPPSPPTAENTLSPAKPKPKRKGARLAEDWTLPDDWRAWAEVNCPVASREQITREALKFANFWQAKPGAQACKLDWRKTWQNWCLTAFATAPVRPAQGFQSAADRKREGQRNTMAIIDTMFAREAVQ